LTSVVVLNVTNKGVTQVVTLDPRTAQGLGARSTFDTKLGC